MVLEKQRGGLQSSTSSSSLSRPPRPREDTPLLGGATVTAQPLVQLSSQSKTCANVFIALIGAGVLGLPYSFMRTGWLTSLLTIFGIAFLAYYCMMLLIYTRIKLRSSPSLSSISSFGDLGFSVCGPIGRFAVDAMIVMAQLGFCVGYLVFIGDTMADLLYDSSSSSTALSSSPSYIPTPIPVSKHHKHGPEIWGISAKSLYIWSCFPFQLGLNSIPTLTLLAPLSIFADIVDLGAMGTVMAENVSLIAAAKQRPAVRAFGSASTFFYGLGVAMFSFEGIAMALPLESEMKDKPKFGKVLGLSMLLVALIYAAFGLVGYLAFGDNTKDIITSNMSKGWLTTLVQLGLCINLFFTFPLMMNPVYEVLERRFWDGGYCIWIRWGVVLITTLVALMVPNFADFLSLVGSSTCCCLGFVFPSLFHYLAFKEEMGWKGTLSDISIMALGVLFAFSGTWYSLLEIFCADA